MGKQWEGVMREVREGRVGELRPLAPPPTRASGANSSSGHSWSVMSSAWHGLVACTLARWLNSDQPREKPPSRPPMAPHSPSPHPALPTFQPFTVAPGNLAAQDQTPPRRGRRAGRESRLGKQRGRRGKMRGEAGGRTLAGRQTNMGEGKAGRPQRGTQERRLQAS